jgi:hypothetical protein
MLRHRVKFFPAVEIGDRPVLHLYRLRLGMTAGIDAGA